MYPGYPNHALLNLYDECNFDRMTIAIAQFAHFATRYTLKINLRVVKTLATHGAGGQNLTKFICPALNAD